MNIINYFWNNSSKIIGLLTLFFLIAGYVDLKSQYFFFRIAIEKYISVSEILINCIENIIGYLFLTFIGFCIVLFAKHKIPKFDSNKDLYIIAFSVIVSAGEIFMDIAAREGDTQVINYIILFSTALIASYLVLFLVDSLFEAEERETKGDANALLWWLTKCLGVILGIIVLVNTSHSVKLIFFFRTASPTFPPFRLVSGHPSMSKGPTPGMLRSDEIV